jgi:hypothetical protein
MKIDLQELKDRIDRELLAVEKRRDELIQQKEHIEAVQRLNHELSNGNGEKQEEAAVTA